MNARINTPSLRLLALFLLTMGGPVAAQESVGQEQARPAREDDWAQRLEQASDLQQRADVIRADARQRFDAAEAACMSKFLVNSCRNSARAEYVKATREARRLENEGKTIERLVSREKRERSDRDREEAAPARAAELNERAELRAREDVERAETRDEHLADKASRAEAGIQRKAEDAERLRQRQAAHAARIADKAAKAAAQKAGE